MFRVFLWYCENNFTFIDFIDLIDWQMWVGLRKSYGCRQFLLKQTFLILSNTIYITRKGLFILTILTYLLLLWVFLFFNIFFQRVKSLFRLLYYLTVKLCVEYFKKHMSISEEIPAKLLNLVTKCLEKVCWNNDFVHSYMVTGWLAIKTYYFLALFLLHKVSKLLF